MSGTHMFYNGVLMQDCETKEFVTTIETEESGTDLLHSRYRLTVSSMIVSIEPPSITDGPFPSSSHNSALRTPPLGIEPEAANAEAEAVDQLRIAEARLREPRKDFWLAVHGTRASSIVATEPTTSDTPGSGFRIVLAATGHYDKSDGSPTTEYPEFITAFSDSITKKFTNAKRKEHIDCNNGPIPQAVSVSIVGGRFLRVQFTIEVTLNICRNQPSGLAPTRDARKVKGVISNRWSVTEDLDANFCTTHNIEGTLVISDHRYKAQAMRTMVHPGLFPYARLEGRTFAVDRTGKSLAYRFAIKEVGIAPPKGLVDWDATYSESSAMGSANQFGTFNIKVRGAVKRPPGQTPQAQKKIMLRLMFAILASRLTGINSKWRALPGQNATTTVVKECVVTENVKEPVMDMRVNVQHTGGTLNDFNLRLGNMGAPIPIAEHDPLWWPIPDYFQYDTASENAQDDEDGWGGSYFDQYQQSPCNLWHSTPRGAKTDEIVLAEDEEDEPDPEEGTPE